MSVFSKVTSAFNDFTDSALGWTNLGTAVAKGVKDVTGLKASDQLRIGLSTGAAAGLSGVGTGSISDMLSGLGSGLLGGLSSIGSGISGLGSALLSGVGDYFNLSQQWKYQKQAMELQDQFNKEAEARQFEYNRRMMWKQDFMNQRAENRAMQNNIQLWNMQNEYNTPAAQMQRLTDAGLNPNLAYGSANTTAGSITSPGTGSVSSHGVSTRATKALVRQAMSLNYQQIQANQLQNLMMAEQIADRRANRALAIEQHPLDMAYRQAQIDAIKNGIDIRSGEYGISAANLLLNQEKFNYDRSKPQSWIGRNYNDTKSVLVDLKDSVLSPVGKYILKGLAPNYYNRKYGN